jgi:imidazolonepropionase-like amidohydrolase
LQPLSGLRHLNTWARRARQHWIPMRHLIYVFSLLLCTTVHAQNLVIKNAKVLDPRTQTVATRTLWIRDGNIVAADRGWFRKNKVEVIDAGGRWLIPGLVDMHVHSFGNLAPGWVPSKGTTPQTVADQVVKVGVTAFLDLFNDEDYMFGLRSKQRAGETGGAEIMAAGPCFTATKGHCSEYGVPTRLINTPEEARQQLAQLLPKKPDVVKVVYDHHDYGANTLPTIDYATLAALLQAAREAGVKTIVHMGTWQDVRDAVKAGASAVTHIPAGLAPDDIGPLLAANKVRLIPTFSVHLEGAYFFDHPEVVDSWAFRTAVTQDTYDSYKNMKRDEYMTGRAASERTHKVVALESIRRLHQAGVVFVAGTDAGNVFALQGFSMHRELEYFVEAGLTPWEALAAATTSAGDFIGRKFGVQEGDVASFVILDHSPLEKISNTQDVWRVVVRGRALDARERP